MPQPLETYVKALALWATLIAPAFAEQIKDEPRDFRGVTWSSEFDVQRENMNLIRREGDVAYYKKKGEALTIGQAEAFKIAYRYYKDQFSAGVVQTFGASNKKALVASLFSMHGEPQRPRKHIEQYVWQGNDASIVLTCEATSYCAAEYFSMALRKQEAEETGDATTFDRDNDD
jgi:hypothetical protein